VKHHQDVQTGQKTFSDLEQKLLNTIEAEGSIRTDRLRKRLRLEGKENNSKFHRSLSNLEGKSLIVGAEDPHPETHLHANIWQTWDTRTSKRESRANLSYQKALAKLLEKTIDACVLVREDQIPKWFEWSSDMQAVKDQSLLDGTIVKSGRYLKPAPTAPMPIQHMHRPRTP